MFFVKISSIMCLKVLFIVFSIIISINSEQSSIQNDLININNKLGLDLLTTFPTNGNNFFSPLSITIALLAVMNGAKGITEREFRQLFHFENKTKLELINEQVKDAINSVHQKEKEKLILKLGNLLLVSNGFPLNNRYQQILNQMFATTIESVDFSNNSKQIVKDINDWVSEQTSGKINSVFTEDEELPKDTPMVLLNAIYFKGIWKYVFDRKNTYKEKFYNFGDITKASMVDMMYNQRDMVVKHSKSLQANIFEMPFGDGSDFVMLVILPDHMDGLEEVTKRLTPSNLNHTLYRVGRGKTSTEKLMFPKLKLESEYNLKEHLETLGLKSLFEDNADLSGVNGAHNLKVSKAIHKAYIEVNEQGAEAAAVTKIVYALRSFRPNPVRVDKPFIFAIIDKKSSLIWFLAQIRDLS